jgi:hypothetical protein
LARSRRVVTDRPPVVGIDQTIVEYMFEIRDSGFRCSLKIQLRVSQCDAGARSYGQRSSPHMTACVNAVHSVEQRFARWLLMARDRMESDHFPLTQEFAAMMLGASRPTVTIAASTLQKAGLIIYRRGDLTIADGAGLEAASCECYRATTDLMNAVMKRARRKAARAAKGARRASR